MKTAFLLLLAACSSFAQSVPAYEPLKLRGVGVFPSRGVGPAGPAGPLGPAGPAGADGIPGVPGYSPNTLLSGGQVVWTSGLNFTVSATVYQIGGTQFSAPETDITLAAADPTDARFDAVVVDSTGAVAVITGTPAASPVRPDVDPASQLLLTFILIPAGSLVPANITTTLIYDENVGPATEWTCTSSGAGMNLNSTTNPHTGLKDLEGTSVSAGQYAKCIVGVPFTLTKYNYLILYVRSKAAWGSNRQIQIQFRLSNASVTPIVVINQNAFGFNTSNTTAYQQIVIPLAMFPSAGNVDEVRFTMGGGGGTQGFYLDTVSLQSGLPDPTTPIGMTFAGAWNNTKFYEVNEVVTYSGGQYIAKAPNVNSTPSDVSADWVQLSNSTGGTVTASGPPVIHQLGVWTSSTNLTGIPVGTTDKPLVGVTGGDPTFSRLTLTNPATAATFTLANNKTFIVNNTLTISGTDSTTMTLPTTSATLARTDAANTFTGIQTFNTAIAIASGGTGTGSTLTGLVRGSSSAMTAAELSGDVTTSGSNATTIASSVALAGSPTTTTQAAGDNTTKIATTAYVERYNKRQCEIVWGGSGTAFALASGDDAVANNSCFNKTGVSWTVQGVYCKSDNASNTTTVHPTFGSAGTGTTLLTGALTCGSSNAYSSTGTIANATVADGSGFTPVMGGTLTGTNIHLLIVYRLP